MANNLETCYFVILCDGHGRPVPLRDEDDQMAVFATHSLAEKAGDDNMLGNAYGFEVFPWDSTS